MRTYIRSTLNQTGLSDGDTLAIGTAIADNTDELLFGTACRDNLDRTPPIIVFEAPTPEAGEVVRQTQMVAARAVDDTEGTPPRITLTGPSGPLTDADGIPDNEVASTTIDTAAVTAATGDGSYTVTASARDISGNEATAERTFVIDNTAPTLTVSATGFFVRTVAGVEQWWSGVATPVLTGTVTDANLADITIRVGAIVLGTATVVGSDWTFTIPAGQANHAGAALDISATDQAGNGATLTRRIYADTTPPQLSAAATTVRDERNEPISFGADTDQTLPVHTHNGAIISLGGTDCPDVYKHVTQMANVTQNPISFDVDAIDEATGIGLDPATVRIRTSVQGVAGSFRQISGPVSAGRMGLPVTLLGSGTASDSVQVVPELTTVDGEIRLDYEARDYLGRLASISLCIMNRPLAPPLEIGSPYVPGDGGMNHPGHIHALRSAGLASGNRVLATTMLNTNGPGLSVMDYEIMNGNQRGVSLQITMPGAPSTIPVTRAYVKRNAPLGPITPPCGTDCDTLVPQPTVAAQPQLFPNASAAWGVRIFELTGPNETGALSTELSCTTCGTGGIWQFSIPARTFTVSGPGPKRYFRVMTVLRALPDLRPTGSMNSLGQLDTSAPPYTDSTLTYQTGSVDITGQLLPTYEGCEPGGLNPTTEVCNPGHYLRFRPYRALTSITLGQLEPFSQPSAAAAVALPFRPASTPRSANFASLTLTESNLP